MTIFWVYFIFYSTLVAFVEWRLKSASERLTQEEKTEADDKLTDKNLFYCVIAIILTLLVLVFIIDSTSPIGSSTGFQVAMIIFVIVGIIVSWRSLKNLKSLRFNNHYTRQYKIMILVKTVGFMMLMAIGLYQSSLG